MLIDICLAVSFGFVVLTTSAWLLQVIACVINAFTSRVDSKVSAMQTIVMSVTWAIYYFCLLQRG